VEVGREPAVNTWVSMVKARKSRGGKKGGTGGWGTLSPGREDSRGEKQGCVLSRGELGIPRLLRERFLKAGGKRGEADPKLGGTGWARVSGERKKCVSP